MGGSGKWCKWTADGADQADGRGGSISACFPVNIRDMSAILQCLFDYNRIRVNGGSRSSTNETLQPIPVHGKRQNNLIICVDDIVETDCLEPRVKSPAVVLMPAHIADRCHMLANVAGEEHGSFTSSRPDQVVRLVEFPVVCDCRLECDRTVHETGNRLPEWAVLLPQELVRQVIPQTARSAQPRPVDLRALVPSRERRLASGIRQTEVSGRS